MKHKHIALLSALMAISMASCKKKTVSSPKPADKKSEEVEKACGINLAKPLGLTELNPVRAAELEVNEPVIMTVSSDDKVTQYVVAFDQVDVSDANKLAQFGKIRITAGGKTIYEKTTGAWSEVVAIPKEYNQQTLEIHVAACVPDWRKVDSNCGPEKTTFFSPNMDGDSNAYAASSKEAQRASKLSTACMKLAGPAAEFLSAIGYLKDGREDSTFEMTKYNAEQRVAIAAAGMIYNNPPALGAACASGFVATLGAQTKSLIEANTKVGSKLALTDGAGDVLACGSEEAKANCLAKGDGHSWDGSVCVRSEAPVQVVVPASEADCTAKGLKWIAEASVCGQTIAMTQADCEAQKLTWDTASSSCVKIEEKITSSYSWPVSIIPEYNDKLCVTSGASDSLVSLATCDKNNGEQRFKVEGVEAGYLSFKSEGAAPGCLTVKGDTVVTMATNGVCAEDTQKFELYEFLQDGLNYTRITLKGDKTKCLGAATGVTDKLSVVSCVRNFSPDALKREMFTLQPNGGGKPEKLNTNLTRPVRLMSELGDRCLSAASAEADFQLGADCADNDKNHISLQAGNFDNYYMVGSSYKDAAGSSYCLTLEEAVDPATKAVTRALKHKVCSSVTSGQKFGLIGFSSASKPGRFALNAHGTPLCVEAATTGTLELKQCAYLSDYETVKAQLFSIKVDTQPAPVVDNSGYVQTSKKDIWTGSIMAFGAALVIGSLAAPGIEKAVNYTRTVSVEVANFGERTAFITRQDFVKLQAANPGVAKLKVEVTAAAVPGRAGVNGAPDVPVTPAKYKIVALDATGNNRIVESPEFTDSPAARQIASIDGRAVTIKNNSPESSLWTKTFGTGQEFGAKRTAGTLLGIGTIIVGALFNTGVLHLAGNTSCDSAKDPFEKFTCKVRQAETEAASIAAQ